MKPDIEPSDEGIRFLHFWGKHFEDYNGLGNRCLVIGLSQKYEKPTIQQTAHNTISLCDGEYFSATEGVLDVPSFDGPLRRRIYSRAQLMSRTDRVALGTPPLPGDQGIMDIGACRAFAG